MAISMYRASVPVFLQMLPCLSALLDKAAGFAEAKKIDPAVLLNGRLAPDMFALARQVQIATDFAKGTVARLAGQEPPKYADSETTIPELKARIAGAHSNPRATRATGTGRWARLHANRSPCAACSIRSCGSGSASAIHPDGTTARATRCTAAWC